ASSYMLHLSTSHPPTSYTPPLSLHDALPILPTPRRTASTQQSILGIMPPEMMPSFFRRLTAMCPLCPRWQRDTTARCSTSTQTRSEEHTSELQSRFDLVCRLLLDKKNDRYYS